VRTYVRSGSERGIYFLTEWVSQALCIPCARWFFQLPYHFGRIRYQNVPTQGKVSGSVQASGRELRYEAHVPPTAPLTTCGPGTLDEFLLECYVAFTGDRTRLRFFRVAHRPWTQTRVTAQLPMDGLLTPTPWHATAQFAGAHYSPGLFNVMMGRPHRA
ncbi:MAG TPA: DUF2071 domain-containing protein, partial [Verrucomicrobiae bacterium]|nr:DUF2071 domain-containing protein [Verrucomicrobiae bacterium]